jgi:hypothetical protein
MLPWLHIFLVFVRFTLCPWSVRVVNLLFCLLVVHPQTELTISLVVLKWAAMNLIVSWLLYQILPVALAILVHDLVNRNYFTDDHVLVYARSLFQIMTRSENVLILNLNIPIVKIHLLELLEVRRLFRLCLESSWCSTHSELFRVSLPLVRPPTSHINTIELVHIEGWSLQFHQIAEWTSFFGFLGLTIFHSIKGSVCLSFE